MRARGWMAALGVAALLAACGGRGDGADGPDGPAPTAIATDAATQPAGDPGVSLAAGVTIPQTRAGAATSWVLEQLGSAEGPAAPEAQEWFEETFLAQVPAEDVATVFAQLRAMGPYVVEEYTGTQDAAQVPLDGQGGRFVLHVVTVADGRMSGLFFEAATEVPDIGSPADLDAALADLDAETSLLVADATCTPLHQRDADIARPIGSIFKLYVLDAVRQAVADGDLTWQDSLTLTDDLRSLPSGILQDEPAGTEVSVQEAAELMISISDNTATDLLMDAVGRDAVLEAVTRLGHHDPQLLTPFLSTREMFQLAFTDAGLREQWAGADAVDREAIRQDLPGGLIEVDEALAADVVWTEGLDWFATAEDLCRAHVALEEHDGEVRQILSANPGIEVPVGWDYVAFKGGSSTGEMAGSWYLGSATGTDLVIVVQIAATELPSVPDAGWMSGVVGQTAEVLTEEE